MIPGQLAASLPCPIGETTSQLDTETPKMAISMLPRANPRPSSPCSRQAPSLAL